MGAGLQRWWLSGSYESACDEYSRKQRSRAFGYGQRWVDTNFLPLPMQFSKVGDRDLEFQSDAETAQRLAASLNAPLTLDQKLRADHLRKTGELLIEGTPRKPGMFEQWNREYLAHFVNHCRVRGAPAGEECSESCDDDSVPNDEVKPWAVNPNEESNVAKANDVEMKILQEISIDSAGIRNGDAIFIGGVKFVASKTTRSQDSENLSTGSAALDQAKPTIPGKFDLVQALADAGMLPAGSAAKRVSASLETLWEHAAKPVGESYQVPVVFPVPQSPTPHEQFDIAVNSDDLWSHRRHPTCDGFVFDNEVTGETVFIAYERLREMAKLLIAPRERTERGEAMRRRLLVAIGHASTLFQGDDGVFDSKRAIKIADDLMFDLELGPGLDSLPGIGRDLERDNRPASDPYAHLDEDLLAEDA